MAKIIIGKGKMKEKDKKYKIVKERNSKGKRKFIIKPKKAGEVIDFNEAMAQLFKEGI